MGALSLLAATPFVISSSEQSPATGTQLELSVTILLTAVAFKFVIAAFLPQISYLTLIDKYVLSCTAVIYVTTVLVAIGGGCLHWADMDAEKLETMQIIFFWVVIGLWILLQLWFIIAACKARTQSTERGVDRASAQLRRRRALAQASSFSPEDSTLDEFEPAANRPRVGSFRDRFFSRRRSVDPNGGSGRRFSWSFRRRSLDTSASPVDVSVDASSSNAS